MPSVIPDAITYPVIVLAAGASSRLGSPKGLVPVDGRPWLECQIERLGECGAKSVFVVLGHDWDAYVAALPWIARAVEVGWFPISGVRVAIARNEAPERGPFSSLQRGALEVLAQNTACNAFVLPVDVPCPGRPVWSALGAALGPGVDAAIPSHAGRGGHPVLLSSRVLAHLAALAWDAPDARLDAQLRTLDDSARARIEVDDVRVTMNLNTKEDWASIAGGEMDDR
jgi:molybdenum cofactor cytidylyltransferase